MVCQHGVCVLDLGQQPDIKDERKQAEKRVNLLLLGAGESGKSTFAKQMKILFLDGYTQDELLSYRNIIRSNCIMGMRTLLLESKKRDTYDELAEELRVRRPAPRACPFLPLPSTFF